MPDHKHEAEYGTTTCIHCGCDAGSCAWCDYWGWVDEDGLCPECSKRRHDDDCGCPQCVDETALDQVAADIARDAVEYCDEEPNA
jgi:hypothetical protein